MVLFRKKSRGPVLKYYDFDMHWDTEDPFIFASHHRDDYPKGNAQQAPPLDMIGWRDLGNDYRKHSGFRMYRGKVVPGFPMHAHWGYETFTVAEQGYIDTFDTEGNQSRFGFGDAQWVTAPSKYQHCEMYPLAFDDRPNPNDITQIMVNLPLEMKGSENSVSMLWSEDIKRMEKRDENGLKTSITLYAGSYENQKVECHNEISWAADPEHGFRIVQFRMEPGATYFIPPSREGVSKNLYFVSGSNASVGGFEADAGYRMKLRTETEVKITNGNIPSRFWLLESVPIGQKMVSFGPVTLNNDKAVRNALNEIRKDGFSQWPWNVIDKAQPRGTPRFIKTSDGREYYPDGKPDGFEPCEKTDHSSE